MQLKIVNKKYLRVMPTAIFVATLILAGTVGLQAQQTVTGSVSDASGKLPGVTITLKGTNVGVLSSADGAYSITVPDDKATLVYYLMGYTSQEIAVGSRTEVNVTLVEEAEGLDEVVVVGYGVQKKVNLTGSVSSISAAKIENRAVPNLSSSLAGLATGVSVRQSSGNPGSDGANIRVRGLGTFSGDYRSPMVIVDGIEGNMNAVNPDDVESLSVLKDAASASIYGSRAANGVILVTTKKGKPDAPAKITYSGMLSLEQPSRRYEFVSDYAEHMDLLNMSQRLTNPAAALPYSQTEVDEWRAAKNDPNGTSRFGIPNWLAYPNTDWGEVLFENRFAQTHNLSITGGSANSSYLLSMGYLDNPGTMQNTGLKRYQFRINFETRLNKFLKVGTQTFASRQDKQPGNSGTAFTYLFQTMAGVTPMYDGKYGGKEAADDAQTTNNPLTSLNGTQGNQLTYRLNTSWYATVNILEGLTADMKFNYQMYQYNREEHPVSLDKWSFRTNTVVQPGTTETDAIVTRASAEEYRPTANILLNYNRSFGSHDVSATLGYEQLYYNYRSFTAQKQGLMDLSIYDISRATGNYYISDINSGEQERDYAMISYFGRVNYAYKGRYLFEANFRRDASSRFSPENRWGTFPSVSGAWRISEEAFFAPLRPIVQNLKLRASWGKLGNTTSGYYDWQATYGKYNATFGNEVTSGLAQDKVANPLLQWENVSSSEIGLEVTLLKRLSLEAAYYNKLTQGILTSPSIYGTMGTVGPPTKNTSDMRNKGIELAVTWNDRIGDFRYSATVNFAYNQNAVVNYLGKMKEGWVTDEAGNNSYQSNVGQAASMSGDQIITEDHPYTEYFLRQVYQGSGTYRNSDGTLNINGGPKDGMIRTPEDLQWVRDMIADGYSFNGRTTITTNGLNYGELIMADVNGDKNYGNSYDRVFTGKSDVPKYTLGFTANFEWKGIDLSMTWAGNFGMWYYLRERGVNQNWANKGNVIPADARKMFYYYNENDPSDPNNNINAPHPRMLYENHGTYISSNHYLYNASYFKLKFLQLGYTFPKEWTQKAQISRLRLFVSGENLLTFTNYPGMDPEIGSGVNVYPISRVLTGGINITF
jgi:TonB-linked SusC/RagA family outer membrane protein